MKLVHDLTGDTGEESPRGLPLTASSSKLKSFWLSQQSAWKLYCLIKFQINNTKSSSFRKNRAIFLQGKKNSSWFFSSVNN